MDVRLCIASVFLLFGCFNSGVHSQTGRIKCYTDNGRPQRCIPEFVNAAFGKLMIANNTCGTPASRYCVQTGVTGATKICQTCDASKAKEAHPARYTTDIKDDTNKTWWQSETLFENKHSVWLWLNLEKTFDITYIRIRFHTSRPQSFKISKKTNTDSKSPWIPYQYYSGSCTKQYDLPNQAIVTRANQKIALCTNEFSGISPLSGGNVAFSTLEDRPDAYNFDSSAELQDWVTASAIRIDLDKLNTFGDEVFGDEYVLRSYYFAISDLAVGGRCKCNGHASECVTRVSGGDKAKLVCRCEHSTAGDDCEKCAPLYNDRPWLRATGASANPCSRCECNDLADACVFDPFLYRTKGRGGRCVDCKNNTDGVNCEKCKVNHYRKDSKEACKPCSCNPTGSRSLQCNVEGVCECRPGVTGKKCDECSPGYFSFSSRGCKPCLCSYAGSIGDNCDATGQCQCKPFVKGKQCDLCKSGYFDIDGASKDGCKPCFCHGHSQSCIPQSGIGKKELRADFSSGLDGWTVIDSDGNDRTSEAKWDKRYQYLRLSTDDDKDLYLVAPPYFLGNRLSSYGKMFAFVYGVSTSSGIQTSNADIILEGAGLAVSFPASAQGNPVPVDRFLEFKYTLKEPAGMKSFDFQTLLSKLTAIKIRVTYLPGVTGAIDRILLESTRVVSENSPDQVTWQEKCLCDVGYSGQFCEECDAGYTREANRSDALGSCVPCECNGHSDRCDPTTGKCECRDNTEGDSCDKCVRGYYGNPTRGTAEDCQKCPCIFGSQCLSIGPKVQCTDCPPGHEGDLCEKCQDGYFGDPEGKIGPATGCRKCNCNGNVDANAIGNCNTTTGECLKCIYNTKNGFQGTCEECKDGYYGDPLALPKGQCKACNCFENGTIWPQNFKAGAHLLPCDAKGQCQCRENVTGVDCSSCAPGLWGVASGNGCETCKCNVIGSNSSVCDVTTGQCKCKAGIGGRECAECAPGHFEFSKSGCRACECHPDGAQYVNCTSKGECICRPGVLGAKCDTCPENKYNLTIGCISCPRCFNLVKDAVNSLREKLKELDNVVSQVNISDVKVQDEAFESELRNLTEITNSLEIRINKITDSDKELEEFFDELKANFSKLEKASSEMEMALDKAKNLTSRADSDTSMAKDTMDKIRNLINATAIELKDISKKMASAIKASSEGSGNTGKRMKEIAQEARQLADAQEADSKQIDMMANMALNTSQKAHDNTNEAADLHKDAEANLKRLDSKAKDASALAKELHMKLLALRNSSKDAISLAEELIANASMPLPDFGINKTKALAEKLLNDAFQSINVSGMVMEEAQPLIDNFTKNEKEARLLMKEGEGLHNEADEYGRRAKEAYTKAKEAQEKAERTAAEAQKTLDILKGFNEQVEKSKRNATEALKLVARIRQLIAEANNNSKNASTATDEASALADEARKTLTASNDTLNGVKQDVMTALNDLARQLNATAEFELNINETLREVKNTSDALETYKQQAAMDAISLQNALNASLDAGDKATEAQDKLDKALAAIDEIVVELLNLDSLDMATLEDAEGRFDVANNTIFGELDMEIERLRNSAITRENEIRMFELSLEPLRRQIAHAQELFDTFPRSCYKKKPPIEQRR